MRIESSVTAISWIPSEAIEGMPKVPFELGIVCYDEPPPDRLEDGDLERLHKAGRFREANHLEAWIEVEEGRIVEHGQAGGALVGSTRFRFGVTSVTIPGVAFDVLRPEPTVHRHAVRFVQTVGGRAGFPAPRVVRGKPYLRIQSATAWTTLALTIRADGTSFHELNGASAFPRHWIYDSSGELVEKSGTIDFQGWYEQANGELTPWGSSDQDSWVTIAESALERRLSLELMRDGGGLERRSLGVDETLIQQGETAQDELFLVLDGVLVAEVDGEEVAEIGPGAILGERALLDGRMRTATLTTRTPCRVVVIPAALLDRGELEWLAATRAP